MMTVVSSSPDTCRVDTDLEESDLEKPRRTDADATKYIAASQTAAFETPPDMALTGMEDLLGVMQHVAVVLEQALNNRRWSWSKLVYLGERHAAALNYVDMLRGYRKAGDAAINYLDEDLSNLLQVPDLADQMRALLQGKAKLNAALHFLHGLDADLNRP